MPSSSYESDNVQVISGIFVITLNMVINMNEIRGILLIAFIPRPSRRGERSIK